MKNFKKLLTDGTNQLNIELSNKEIQQFYDFFNFVTEYNKFVNLTAITDERDFIIKHFIDSLTAENLIPKNAVVCDIGAGAGFPSLPIKIVRDDLNFILMEALNKRVIFLEKAITKLGINNTEAVHIRAEDAGKSDYRGKFDVVLARAVANIKILVEYAIPLLKVNGLFIAYKGSNLDELFGIEKSLKKINAKIIEIKKINLPVSNDERSLIIIKKIGKTPPEFPRNQAKIKKFPL